MNGLIMSWTRSRLIAALRELSAEKEDAFFEPSEDFDGQKGGIWTGAEGTPSIMQHYPAETYTTSEGKVLESKAMSFESPMWDYWEYETLPHKQLPEVTELLEKAGWYSEFHDAGTVMIWKN